MELKEIETIDKFELKTKQFVLICPIRDTTSSLAVAIGAVTWLSLQQAPVTEYDSFSVCTSQTGELNGDYYCRIT